MNKAIKTIYIAGKMQDDEWRQALFDPYPQSDSDHALQLGYNPVTVEPGSVWPKSTDPQTEDIYSGSHGTGTVCGLAYTGPFFVDTNGGHGFSYSEEDEHGGNVSHPERSAERVIRRQEVQQLCLQAITKADLVLAWIDCIDCYGTIAEIGYAKALEKPVWIVGPRPYSDLWFVYHMGDEVLFLYGRQSLKDAVQDFLDKHQRYYLRFDSPIEQAFWDEWYIHTRNTGDFELTPQHPLGKYKVDFAHVKTKTAIELDGHATHSSPDAIAYDRKRQREIEAMGWHVIRFGGKEITSRVSFCIDETWMLLNKRMGEVG